MTTRFFTTWVLILACSSLPAFSFAGEGSKLFNAGIKLGANLSQLEGSSWDQSFRAGLQGGIFLGLRSKNVGVQVEGLLNQQTYKTGNSFDDFFHSYYNDIKDSVKRGSFVVNSLSVPLLFQLRPFGNVWLQAGPEYHMILQVKDKDQLVKDADAMFKRGAVNGVLGLWLKHGAHLNSGARYVFGITDLNNSTIQQNWNTRNIQLFLGLSF